LWGSWRERREGGKKLRTGPAKSMDWVLCLVTESQAPIRWGCDSASSAEEKQDAMVSMMDHAGAAGAPVWDIHFLRARCEC
jgi:hypothetical protein